MVALYRRDIVVTSCRFRHDRCPGGNRGDAQGARSPRELALIFYHLRFRACGVVPETQAVENEMAATRAEILPHDDERRPFKVVFWHGGSLIAEQPVTSVAEANKLIDAILPHLPGFVRKT